jgi:hypothetical protein
VGIPLNINYLIKQLKGATHLMKNNFTKIMALLMTLTLIFSLAACTGGSNKETTTAAGETTTAAGETTTAAGETTTAAGETTTAAGETTTAAGETTAAIGETTTAVPVTAFPTTKAQILAAYTTVMNKAKVDKPAYNKVEFQALPKADQHMDGAVISAILPLATSFMTQEKDATVENNPKGSDMKWFPVGKSTKGCLLTNVNAIKTATCVKLANGDYKITIILKDEVNPEPYSSGPTAPSYVGAMFDPIERASIDDTLKNDSTVNKVVKDVNFSLTYQNSTAVLEYNPKTNQVVTLNQNMYTFIDIQSGKVLLLFTAVGTAVLTNTMKIWNVKY